MQRDAQVFTISPGEINRAMSVHTASGKKLTKVALSDGQGKVRVNATSDTLSGDKQDSLPPHIRAAIEMLERLKTEREAEQQQLEALADEPIKDASLKEDLMKIQRQRVWQLDSRILLASEALQKALRDADIRDTGTLLDILT